MLRLRDDNNRGLAGGDLLGRVGRLGVDRRVDGLALAVAALVVGVAVILAVIEVVTVLIDIADELASVVDRVVLVTLALRSVADDALVALLVLVVGVVAVTVVADLELVPGVVVALLRVAEAIVTDNLPLGAGGAVSLRSTVVTVADDDDIGGDDGEDLGDSLGGSLAVVGDGDGGSGGADRESLGDEVGVGDGLSVTGVHTVGDVDGQENVDGDLSAHESIASKTTTVLVIVTRADDVTLVSANGRRGLEVKLATTVAAVVVKTEEVGAQARISTALRVVLLAGVSLSEAGETVLGREAAEEVEAIGVANATSSASGGGGSGASDGTGLSLSLGGGGVVAEAARGELGSGHVAHGQGDDLGVTHLVDGKVLMSE